jgi:hypothetical protein
MWVGIKVFYTIKTQNYGVKKNSNVSEKVYDNKCMYYIVYPKKQK